MNRNADAENGRFHILLEQSVPSISLDDYGAVFIPIPLCLLNSVRSAESCMEKVKFKARYKLVLLLRIDTGSKLKFSSSNTIILYVNISLRGGKFQVRIRGDYFLVTDEEMDEFLLCRQRDWIQPQLSSRMSEKVG